MPSKKVISLMIICLGIIFSIFLVSREKKDSAKEQLSNIKYIDIKTPDSQWDNILSGVVSNSSTTILTNISNLEDTTLTSQMTKDFLSRYIASINNSESPDDVIEKMLKLPEYQNISGAKYIAKNLNIIKKSDITTLRLYEDRINTLLREKSSQIKEDPTFILQEAINSANETKLKKLDPIILLNKEIIKGMLDMEVPEKAVSVHLNLLNSMSNLLTDIESMRGLFVDPLKSLLVIGQYPKHFSSFKKSLDDLNQFFSKN